MSMARAPEDDGVTFPVWAEVGRETVTLHGLSDDEWISVDANHAVDLHDGEGA